MNDQISSNHSQPDQTELVRLLQEQNQYLAYLCHSQKNRDRWALANSIAKFLFIALPLLGTAILLGYFYYTFQQSISNINNNLNAVKENISKVLPDFSGAQQQLENSWKQLTGER